MIYGPYILLMGMHGSITVSNNVPQTGREAFSYMLILLLNLIFSKLHVQDIISSILGEEIGIWIDFTQDHIAIAEFDTKVYAHGSISMPPSLDYVKGALVNKHF